MNIIRRVTITMVLTVMATAMVACSDAHTGGMPQAGTATGTNAASTEPQPRAGLHTEPASGSGADEDAAALPAVTVHKSPTCGCCELWVEHLREAGFTVEVRDHAPDALNRLKLDVGIPYGKGSCHTAEVGGYFVEGHVPAADIKRLLAEAPDAKGLALPGMPLGSPGMEVPDGTVQPYTVELVGDDGGTAPFASH